MIIATRNRLIHAYLGIDDRILWSMIRESVPDLLAKLRNLRVRLTEGYVENCPNSCPT